MGEYLAKWRELHPHWEVILWTDATMREFVAKHHPHFVKAYDGYGHPIQRADSFRYLVLDIMGGVYSDLDVEPYKPIDELIENRTCIAGVEPDEHMGADRKHSGTPYLVTNAFIGAAPGHLWVKELVALLPKVADVPDIFLSTGPAVTTAAAARIGMPHRPTLLLPEVWSPDCDGGRPCETNEYLRELLSPAFEIVGAKDGAVVSHHWMTSWVPWDKRHKWLAKPFHALHRLKWSNRARRFPHLAAFKAPDAAPYFDQREKPMVEWPAVDICISLLPGQNLMPALANCLATLDYPHGVFRFFIAALEDKGGAEQLERARDELTGVGFSPDFITLVPVKSPDLSKSFGLGEHSRLQIASAKLRNALADAPHDADWEMFVGGEVGHMQPETLKKALSFGRPIIALRGETAAGEQLDRSVYRYHWGGGIRVGYKIVGEDGIAGDNGDQREFLDRLRAFPLIPLDGVGRGFVLIAKEVFEAGVRFAEEPHELHLDGEGLALMAREKGFESAGYTGLSVIMKK